MNWSKQQRNNMSIFNNNPAVDNDDNAEEVIAALKFQPTADMVQDKAGAWRYKAGTKDQFGNAIGGKWVKGSPSANPSGRTGREKEVIEFCQAVSMDMAEVLYGIAMNPDATEKGRIQCANSLLDRALGKPKQQTEIINPTNVHDLIRPIIVQAQPEQDDNTTDDQDI